MKDTLTDAWRQLCRDINGDGYSYVGFARKLKVCPHVLSGFATCGRSMAITYTRAICIIRLHKLHCPEHSANLAPVMAELDNLWQDEAVGRAAG